MTLPALAVTLLFGVLKFPNFAVGAMMTVAAYLAFALNAQLGWPLFPAAAAAALAMGVICIGIDQVTFKPLRERGGITLMVASLGLGFILENIARFAYGNSARSFAGALIIGVVSELSTLVMAPNYRIGVPLCAIAIILIFRPQGLFGQPYIRK